MRWPYKALPFLTLLVLQALLLSFWLFLPAYVANPAAVLFGGGPPMDFGKVFRDGRRVLGDGKTWRGFFGGGLSGVLLGLIQWAPATMLMGRELNIGTLTLYMGPVATLSFGALLGDTLGSFIKRRLGMQKGQRAPVLDQYDFVLGAMAFTAAAFPSWLLANYLLGEALFGFILIIAITPVLHRVVNIIGYRMGKKEVPW